MAARRGAAGPAGALLAVVVLAILIGGASWIGASSRAAAPASAGTAVPSAVASASAAPSGRASAPPAASAGSALAALQRLEVKGPAPLTGYVRTTVFGEAWLDVDHNGCDTRDDVLARDLRDVQRRGGCRVVSGVLTDPYTRQVIHFVRGPRTSTEVQIDHVVALADAWRTGAQALSQSRREQLANDPVELLAVDGPENEAKGDGDAATWLPPNKAFRCTYVAHQIAVKTAYHLWVVPAERAAMQRVLATCPAEPLPAG